VGDRSAARAYLERVILATPDKADRLAAMKEMDSRELQQPDGPLGRAKTAPPAQ
jgi:hypothetical protein